MPGELLPTAVGAFVQEVVSRKIDEYQRKQREAAREILLAEVKSGRADACTIADEDEVLRAVSGYLYAVEEGAGRSNMRRMAQVLKGTILGGDSNADRALYFLRILADMTEEEVFLAATIWQIFDENEGEENPFYKIVRPTLVPSTYPNEESLYAACARLSRTGLIYPIPAIEVVIYEPSPLLAELVGLVDMQIRNNPI